VFWNVLGHEVCRDFAVAEQHPTVQCMSSITLCDQMSYTDALALFFLMLNIDTHLK
jgi:hypothetical protein